MRDNDPTRRSLILVTAVILVTGLGAIGGAWSFQIFADLVPCPLCLQQRWPYYLGLPTTALALVLLMTKPSNAAPRALFGLVALLFIAGAGLALYHSGVEWHWWPGPGGCATGAGAPTSAGNLLQQMTRTKVVACDEAAWRLLGLSLAGYNFLISAGLAALAVWAARRRA